MFNKPCFRLSGKVDALSGTRDEDDWLLRPSSVPEPKTLAGTSLGKSDKYLSQIFQSQSSRILRRWKIQTQSIAGQGSFGDSVT